MMDFNLILLLVGLGLLLLVSVFVLLGCFAGLKKELNCAAIAFVVLLLTLLVFGNSSTILDADGSLLKTFIQGIPSSAETIWDCVVAIAQSSIPGGAEIFAEGTKSYAFLYSVVGGLARGVMLIVGTFIMFILSAIGIGIYRLVTRIVAHSKAKRRAAAGIEEQEPEADKVIADNVLVAQSEAGDAEGVMITAGKEPVNKKATKHRVWAGCLAGLRAVIVIIFLLAPVSGVCSVLDAISPETEKLINESLSGGKQNTAANDTALDIALDFKDAYYDSALGKFIEGSQFFFKDSFSTHLFDSAFTIEGEKNDIEIREEAIVIIEAVNALEGNTNLKELGQVQLENALDALKDSELLVEVMPVVVEVAYYLQDENGLSLKDVLFASKQQAAFLQLRQLDWDKNIEVLLDVVKEAYKLGILEDDFNVLTMDAEQLSVTLAKLAESDAVSSLLNIAIQTALKLPKITEVVGELPAADLSDFSWAQEYQTIVALYAQFQKFGITSFENFDAKALVEDILNDEEKLQVVVDLINKVTELQLVNKVAYNAAIGYVSNIKLVKDAGTDVVQAVKDLSKVNWSEDINIYVEALVKALELVEFEEGLKVNVDYLNLDVEVLHDVVDTLFATESFEKLLPIAANIALGLPKVQELLGNQEVVINTANINWNQDFTTLVNIYGEFQNLEVKSVDEFKDALALVKRVFADEAKVESVKSILGQLADTTLFNDVVVPAANAIVTKVIAEKAPSFDGILDLTQLTEEEWKNDFASLVNIAQNVYDICGFDFNLAAINFDEVGGELGTEVIDLLLNLNLLGNDETKNQLVLAALAQFKVFDEETIANIDLSGVIWDSDGEYSENANLQAILTIVAKMAKIEGVDVNKLTFDWNAILENDDTYEYIVDLLDVVVDSKLILELVPSLLEKFVVPQLDKFEDEDGTLNEVINGLESEALVLEVQKLVDVVKAVVELNVLKVKEEGIQAIDFANTDAIKTIINGIFDCQLIDGYEGRLVRILLKVTGLFPELEKGIFDHVDFDKEQELLIAAIDELEIVLQDEDFLSFDENGKLVLKKEFFLEDETLDAFLGALKVLFGEYSAAGSVDGSQIVEAILPEVINKFVIKLIPEQFAELAEILNLENAHPRLLADDIRKVLYVAEILVDEQVQLYFKENDYNFAGGAEALQEVISTIFDLNMVHGSEAELVAWALNYVQKSAKLDVEVFTAEHFANVDWELEVDLINELLADVIKLTNINKVSTVNSLINFIKEKGFLSDDFLEEINYKVVVEIIEDVFNLQLVEELLPVGLEYALKLAKEKDFDLSFLGETMTGELLVEDLMSIVDALEVAVYDIQIFEYKKAGWKGELPELQYVTEILDIIVNLNLVKLNENDLLTFVVKKFIPANDFVNDTDFAFDAPFELAADVEVIKEVLAVVYDLIHANNITKVEQVVAFFKEKWYTNTDLVKDYNLYGVADLIEVVSDLQLLQQALFAAMDNVTELDALKKLGDFSSLTSLSKEELVSDLKTIADVIRLAVDANLLQYYELHDLEPIEYAKLAQVLETVGTLNVLNKCASTILPSVLNNVLANNANLNIEYEFTTADFAEINWASETKLLGEALVELGALCEVNNLDSLSDILLFVHNKDFLNSAVVTTENANKLVEVLDILVESKLVQAALPAGLEFGLNIAKQQGLDLTFLKGELTGEELLSDLNVIVEILRNAVDFGAVEYVATGDIADIDASYLVNIVALLEELNILTCAQTEWTALVVGFIEPLVKIDLKSSALDYSYVNYAAENELLQQAVQLLGELLSSENIDSISDIKQFIENKDYLNVNAYNDNAIDNAQELVLLLAQSELVALNLTELFEFGIDYASNLTKLDLSFLSDRFAAEELQEDLRTLVAISEHAVEFGIVDVIFLGDAEINVNPVIEAVKLLEEMNILSVTNDNIAALVFNMFAPKLGIEEVTAADFVDVNFAKENAILVEIIKEVGALLEVEGLETVAEVVSFVVDKDYLYVDKYEQIYSDEAIDVVCNILKLAVSSDLVQLKLVEVFNYAVTLIPENLDVEFLKNSVTTEELVSDVDVLIEIIKLAVEFGALDYVFTGNIEVVNLDILVKIVALFEELNLLTNNNKQITALVYNLVYDKLGVNQKARNASVVAEEFANINYANENVKLQEVIALVKNLQNDFELTSLEDVIAFVKDGAYKDYKAFKPEVYTHAQEIVNAVVDFELVQYGLPTLLDLGLDKANAAGVDLTYLSGVFNGAELASDIKVLVNEAVYWLRDLGVLDVLETKELKGQYVGALADTVRALKDVNLATYKQETLVTILTNLIYKNVIKYEGEITENYFDGIDWLAEIDNVADAIDEFADIVETFGVYYGLLSVEGIKEFINNEAKNFEIYNDEELLNNVADVILAISKSDALSAELEFGQEYLISFLAAKDIYLSSILSTKEQLQEDLVVLANAVKVVYPSNVLGYALCGEELNQEHFAELVNAVEQILALNVLSDSKADILDVVFTKLGVNVNKVALECIDWNAEIEVIGELLFAANDLLVTLELTRIADVLSLNVKEYLTVNYNTNDILTDINDLLAVVIESQLVEETLFALSERFLTAEAVVGFADLHNIYNNFQELEADIINVMAAINGVIELDLCSFLVEGDDIPYEKVDAIEAIITNLFGLNYINNEGRIAELAAKTTSIDSSNVDFSQIDLIGDAELIVAAYKDLLPILTDSEFFIKNVQDLSPIVINDIKYWLKDEFVSAIKSSALNVLKTTLIRNTNGAILLLLIPVFKVVLPDYYEAIDPERLTVEQLTEDFNSMVDLARELKDINFSDVKNGVIFTSEIESLIINAINTISTLNLLDGRFEKVVLVTADRLDSKRIYSYYFDKELYNFTDVSYDHDAQVLVEMLKVVFDLVEAEGIDTFGEAKAFFTNKQNIKDLAKDAAQVERLGTIARLFTSLDLVNHNILPVYNEALESFVAKYIGSDLANVSDVYTTSEAMNAELSTLIDIVRDLIKFGALDILQGATINYDQAELVKDILNNIASLQYVNAKKVQLLEFVDNKVSFDLSQINIASMDLVNDLAILGEIYEQLIPVLLSEHNPFTTLDAIKALTIVKSDLYALIYDYQSIYPSVVRLTSEISIASDLVKLAAEKVGARLSGLLLEVYEIVDIQNASDAEIIEDILVVADILTHVEKLDLLRKVLYKEDIYVTDSETFAALVESVFELNLVDNKFAELLVLGLEKVLNLDLTDVDLSTVDADAEQALIVEVVRNCVVIANSLGVEKLSEVKPYIKDTLSAVKADVKEAVELIKNKQVKAAIKALIETVVAEGRKVNGAACLELVDLASESELVVKFALPIYEQLIAPRFTGTLAELIDLSDYTEEMIAEDLILVAKIAHSIYDSKIYQVILTKALPGEEVIPYVEDIVRNACELNILDIKVEDLAIVLEKVYGSHIDLSAIDFGAIDFSADKEIFASLVEYGYVLAEQILANGLNRNLVFNTVAYNAVVDAYEVAIDTTFVQVLAPQVMKATFSLASEKLGGTIAKLINALDINSIADEELLQDLPVYAEILRDLEAVNAYALVLNKEDITITDADAYAKLVEDVFALVLVDNKFGELLVKVVEKVLNVDLSNVDMNAVDYDAEQALIVEAVRNGVVIANSLGVEKLSEVKPYLVNTLSAVKADVKEAVELIKNKQVKAAIKALIETVVAEGRKANGAACLELVDLASESELVVKFALPIYEQLIASRFTGTLAVVADLSDYSEELFREDLGLVAKIAHSIYDSKIYQVILTKALPGEEVIPYLEDIVRNACELNILDVKKADVLVVAQAVLDKLGVTEYIRKVDKDFDLAQYDLDSVSFKADAEIYASMVPYAYEVMEGLFESGLNSSFFANTDAIYALVEIYTISIETTLVKSFAEKVFAVVDKLNNRLPITINVNEEEVLYNISDFLFGLIELGVFSNDGIDFTDAATIEMMKQSVYDSVVLPQKLQTLINRVLSRAYAYGVVPFNWDIIDVKHEVKVAYALAKQALSFVQENASRIKALDLSMLADAEVQADLTEMIETISESSFVEQLFFPFVEGTFNALTLGYTDGVMIYDATLEDVVTYSVPNFWKVVNAVYEITEFKPSNINVEAILSNLDAVAEIVEVICTDKMTKDNIAKVMITGVEFFTSYDFTDAQVEGLLAINFANEVPYYNAFFAELQETYDATHFALSLSSIKNPQVLEGLADALEAILPSELVELLAMTGAKAVNNRIVKKVSAGMYELLDERLNDEAYTTELLIEDLYAVAKLMRLGAQSNVIGNTQDFAAWNFDVIRQIITIAFDTNIAQGYEADFAEFVIERVPQINELYDESVVVADWEAEALAIVNALESLVNDGVTDVNNIDVDAISGQTVECILESEILSNLIIDMINAKLEEQDLDEYYVVTKAKLDAVVDWDAELNAINELTALMNGINNGNIELAEIISECKDIRNNTVLVNDILISCAGHIVPKLPIISDYYNDSIVINDWAVELDAIIVAFETLDGKHVDTMEDPIENLNGEIIIACLGSVILTEAFIEEFNKNLDNLGLASYYVVTEEKVNAVDTAEKWDKELVAIQKLEAVVASIQDNTITMQGLKDAQKEVESTIIAKEIFNAVLNANDEEVPTYNLISIKKAIEIGSSKGNNQYTTEKYYIEGTVKGLYNTTYGNMYITDGTNEILVYGLYSADGSLRYDKMTNKPIDGDRVVIYGVLGQYSGNPQFKNAWLIDHSHTHEYVSGLCSCGAKDPDFVIPEPKEISISEAIAIGSSKSHNTYTLEKYIIEGTVTGLYNTTYGNFYVTDGTNKINVYGLYSADGSLRYDKLPTKPVDGDKVVIVGVLGSYNGTPQFKNAYLLSVEAPLPPHVHVFVEGKCECGEEDPNYVPHQHVFVDGKCECGEEDPNYIAKITIAEAIALGEAQANGTNTVDKYYIEGTVTGLYNATSGYFYVTDGTNQILVYGLYNSDGTKKYNEMDVKPVDGDKVVLLTVVSQSNYEVQLKDAWLVNCDHTHNFSTPYCPCGAKDPNYQEPSYTTISVFEAIQLASSQNNNQYTTEKYYVYVEIVEVTDTKNGSMYVTDGLNTIFVNGLYSADGSVRYDSLDYKPQAGDVIILYGVLGQSKGTSQFSNAWLIDVE